MKNLSYRTKLIISLLCLTTVCTAIGNNYDMKRANRGSDPIVNAFWNEVEQRHLTVDEDAIIATIQIGRETYVQIEFISRDPFKRWVASIKGPKFSTKGVSAPTVSFESYGKDKVFLGRDEPLFGGLKEISLDDIHNDEIAYQAYREFLEATEEPFFNKKAGSLKIYRQIVNGINYIFDYEVHGLSSKLRTTLHYSLPSIFNNQVSNFTVHTEVLNQEKEKNYGGWSEVDLKENDNADAKLVFDALEKELDNQGVSEYYDVESTHRQIVNGINYRLVVSDILTNQRYEVVIHVPAVHSSVNKARSANVISFEEK